jgi:hypothetical protein
LSPGEGGFLFFGFISAVNVLRCRGRYNGKYRPKLLGRKEEVWKRERKMKMKVAENGNQWGKSRAEREKKCYKK